MHKVFEELGLDRAVNIYVKRYPFLRTITNSPKDFANNALGLPLASGVTAIEIYALASFAHSSVADGRHRAECVLKNCNLDFFKL